MNDRELLEMAAKAAGYAYAWMTPGIPMIITSTDKDSYGVSPQRAIWNPLTDDGDALRLAVTLGMRVYVYPGNDEDYSIAATDREKQLEGWASENHGLDPAMATRRAITRAAAEIGRAMP